MVKQPAGRKAMDDHLYRLCLSSARRRQEMTSFFFFFFIIKKKLKSID